MKNITRFLKFNIKKIHLFIFNGLYLLMVSPVWASDSGPTMPWDGPLTKIENALTGTTAHLAIVIAIASTGLGYAFSPEGGILKKAMSILVGGSIAVGASSLYLTLQMGGAVI